MGATVLIFGGDEPFMAMLSALRTGTNDLHLPRGTATIMPPRDSRPAVSSTGSRLVLASDLPQSASNKGTILDLI